MNTKLIELDCLNFVSPLIWHKAYSLYRICPVNWILWSVLAFRHYSENRTKLWGCTAEQLLPVIGVDSPEIETKRRPR